MKRGFTLIELLVVISAIGLLSSIVLVSLSGAREKAIIAKSLEASHTINNAIGAYAIGIWDFNEGAGNIVKDSSGYNNNGNWSGTADWVANTVTELGWAGQFNNSAYVSMGDPANGILDLGTGDFSLSAWFYISSLPGVYKTIVSKGDSGTAGCGIEIASNNRITCSIQGPTVNRHIYGSIPKTGVWHYVVCVFDRDDKVFVYLDGKEITNASIADSAGSVNNNLPFCIGVHCNSSSAAWMFVGQIDEVRVFTSTLTAEEVKKNYAQGLEKYKITKK